MYLPVYVGLLLLSLRFNTAISELVDDGLLELTHRNGEQDAQQNFSLDDTSVNHSEKTIHSEGVDCDNDDGFQEDELDEIGELEEFEELKDVENSDDDEEDYYEVEDEIEIGNEEDDEEDEEEEEDDLSSLDAYSDAYAAKLREIGIESVVQPALGITYSFYRDDRSCKSAAEISSDLAKLSSFRIIRIYDVDCDGIGIILKHLEPHQQVFVGIYDPYSIDVSIEILSRAVQEFGNNDWQKIHTVAIGNEMVNFGRIQPQELGAVLTRAKAMLNAKGYTGPVVTTDTLVAVLNNRELCTISDYIAVNSHPYWDGRVAPQEAGPWLEGQLQMLNDVCERNGKEILLAETGWPTQGRTFGEFGVPSKDNQLIAIKSIVDTLGPRTILFTTFNDYWKDGGDYDVEKFWGIY